MQHLTSKPAQAPLPVRYLRTKEAAQFLSLSARTLEKHRTYGTGPSYKKLGGRVVYSIDDLQIWVERGAMTSTSDLGGKVLPAKPQSRELLTSQRQGMADSRFGSNPSSQPSSKPSSKSGSRH